MLEIDRKALENLSPEDREKALALLEQIEQIGEQVPLTGYFPHEKQQYFHSMQQRFKAFFGGNQSGKTVGGLVDDLIQALNEEDIPERLLKYKKFDPPFYCRIFTTDLITLQFTLLEKLKKLVDYSTLQGGKWEGAYDKQLRVLRFANGSIFQFMTYEQETKRMGGATLHRIHYDEEPPKKVRAENTMRVMKLGGDEILTMTPLEGFTWTYDDIYEKTASEQFKVAEHVYESSEVGMVMVDIEDNPAITKKNREYTLRQYAGEEKKARKTGQFIPLEGMIYKGFDANTHVINARPTLPDNVNVVVGIDPGIGEAMGVLWCYLTSADDLVCFDELFVPDQTIEQVCGQILTMNAFWDCHPLYYVIDPHARNRNPQTGRSDQMAFADCGIATIPGQDDVKSGLGRVKSRIEENQLYVWDSCVNLLREFRKYRWKPQKNESGDSKPKPVKKDDHLLDALRYIAMSRPYAPREQEPEEERDPLQQLMREDQLRAGRPKNKSEFGGIYN